MPSAFNPLFEPFEPFEPFAFTQRSHASHPLCANLPHITRFVRNIPAIPRSTLEPPTPSATIPTMQTSNRFTEYNFDNAFNLSSPGIPEEVSRDSVTEGVSALLPRPSGEGGFGAAEDGWGLTSPPNSPSAPSATSAYQSPSFPDPESPIPDPSSSPLTNTLLEDLFNPSISSLDLCELHNLSLSELAVLLESDQFRRAHDATQRINAARAAIVEPESKTLALVRTHDLLKDKPTTPAHAETQRKAASTLLSRASAGRAEQRDAEGASALLPRPCGEGGFGEAEDGWGLPTSARPPIEHFDQKKRPGHQTRGDKAHAVINTRQNNTRNPNANPQSRSAR